MKFPNAYAGIKKVFIAEILVIIASVLSGVAVVSAVGGIAAAEVGSEIGASAGLLGGGILILASGVIAIIALVMNLVGLNQAGKDEPRFFKVAFYLSIFLLVLQILASVFSTSTFSNIISGISTVWNILIFIYVLFGIRELAAALNRDDIIGFGNKIMWIYIIAVIITAIVNFIPGSTASGILGLIGLILSLVSGICYLVLLAKTKKMLAEG